MKVKCRLLLEYESSDEAEQIEKSLKPDNESFITTHTTENIVEVETEGNSIPSLLHTMNDFLSCLSVAERTIEVLK